MFNLKFETIRKMALGLIILTSIWILIDIGFFILEKRSFFIDYPVQSCISINYISIYTVINVVLFSILCVNYSGGDTKK